MAQWDCSLLSFRNATHSRTFESLVSFSSPHSSEIGVWFNWLAELIAPLFIFWPRVGRHIAGVVIVLLQIVLILSGNLSFLNWLTIIPALLASMMAFGLNFFLNFL
jgi:Protein of unknown function (DUF1222).